MPAGGAFVPGREHYDHDLLELQRQIVGITDQVDRALISATWALFKRDATTARRIIERHAGINLLRASLDERALQIVARQQPFAGDLRTIIGLMLAASELERIAEYARGIARIVLRSVPLPPFAAPTSLQEMAQVSRDMLRQAVTAMVERDRPVREQLEHGDNLVDGLYQQVLASLTATMREQPAQIEAATYMLWAAHNFERVADRAINIAERASYIATGMLSPRHTRA